MFRRAFILFLNFLLFFGQVSFVFAAENSLNQELRSREIEKAVFMASGTQARVLKIGLVACLLYSLKNNS